MALGLWHHHGRTHGCLLSFGRLLLRYHLPTANFWTKDQERGSKAKPIQDRESRTCEHAVYQSSIVLLMRDASSARVYMLSTNCRRQQHFLLVRCQDNLSKIACIAAPLLCLPCIICCSCIVCYEHESM